MYGRLGKARLTYSPQQNFEKSFFKKSIKRGKTMKSSTRWKKEKILASLTDRPKTKACRLDTTY